MALEVLNEVFERDFPENIDFGRGKYKLIQLILCNSKRCMGPCDNREFVFKWFDSCSVLLSSKMIHFSCNAFPAHVFARLL